MPSDTPEPADTVAEAVNGFGADLFHQLARGRGNVAFSPAGVMSVLAMAAAGARAETAGEMHRVMHLGGEPGPLVADLRRVLTATSSGRNRDSRMLVGNALFGERSLRFEENFLLGLRSRHAAVVEALDFRGAPEAATRRMDAWVATKTEGHIHVLVPASAIPPTTTMVLANAIFLDARWRTPFDVGLTIRRPFELADHTQVLVETMSGGLRTRIGVVDGAIVLELPYRGGAFAMRFILPPITEDPQTWITRSHLTHPAPLAHHDVTFMLPRFRIDARAPMALSEALRALGMQRAWDEARADFSGIAARSEDDERIHLSEIFHQVQLSVDEGGTVASSSAGIVGAAMGPNGPPPPRFVAFDRPFLFELVELRSNVILFLGLVADPRPAQP